MTEEAFSVGDRVEPLTQQAGRARRIGTVLRVRPRGDGTYAYEVEWDPQPYSYEKARGLASGTKLRRLSAVERLVTDL